MKSFWKNQNFWLVVSLIIVLLLALASLLVGVYKLSWAALFTGEQSETLMVIVVSRIPRTLALLLVGMSTSVAGMIMQMLSRNKFVSPSTAGTVESAALGILVIMIFAPNAGVGLKILVSAGFALAGTLLFLAILQRIPLRSPLIVPLLGIMLGGIISAATSFLAYRMNFLASLSAWINGDFARVLQGRYELLWLSGLLTLLAYIAADRFTVIGLGEAFSKNLGINYRAVMALGLSIVSIVTAVNVVTVGAIPFLGLIVPNVVSQLLGDNLRRSVPWVMIFGAGFVLVADILGRVLRYPFEVPISTVVGVVGSALFLYLLLRKSPQHG